MSEEPKAKNSKTRKSLRGKKPKAEKPLRAKSPRQKIRRHKSHYEQKSLRQRSPCERRSPRQKIRRHKNPYMLEYKAGKSLTSEDSKASKILLCQSLKTKSRAKKFVAPCKSSKGGWCFAKHTRSTAASTTFILSPVQKGGWRFVKSKFAQSKDKTRKDKYVHCIHKIVVRITRKITLRNKSEENVNIHFA